MADDPLAQAVARLEAAVSDYVMATRSSGAFSDAEFVSREVEVQDATKAAVAALHAAREDAGRCVEAINWACGTREDFEEPPDAPRYWWRKGLRERAGLIYDGKNYVAARAANQEGT